MFSRAGLRGAGAVLGRGLAGGGSVAGAWWVEGRVGWLRARWEKVLARLWWAGWEGWGVVVVEVVSRRESLLRVFGWLIKACLSHG